MIMQTMYNPTNEVIAWSMDGVPGSPSAQYSAEPDGFVDVPKPYVDSGWLAQHHPGLVRAPTDGEMAAASAEAEKAKAKEADLAKAAKATAAKQAKEEKEAKAKAKADAKAAKAAAAEEAELAALEAELEAELAEADETADAE